MKSEAFFDWLLAAYDRGLKWSLSHQPLMLLILFATIGATVYYYVTMPKGFFPQADTGYVQGISEARQDISFAAMLEHQKALADIIGKDPDVADVAFCVGVTGGSQAINTGRFWVNLKPRNERDAHRGPDHQPATAAACPGPRSDVVPASRPGRQHGRPAGALAIPVHAPGREP